MPRVRLFLAALFVALGLGMLGLAVAPSLVDAQSTPEDAQLRPVVFDPGVRGGAPGAGGTLLPAGAPELPFFKKGLEAFKEVNSVSGTLPDTSSGLGPRFNLDSCAGCHAQPAVGGSSPFNNPQIAVAHKAGAHNPENLSAFIKSNGPVREVRFKTHPDGRPDGGVHALFTITGRTDAAGCNISQPDFNEELARGNVVFRIPTPVFGGGLIEAIDDRTIVANKESNRIAKLLFGISGEVNREGNAGTITRFGWKAQNKSLELFAAEAYNVESGVTNEIFPNKRDETAGCVKNPTPEDHTNYDASNPTNPVLVPSDVMNFTFFLRFLAPPQRQQVDTSTAAGVELARTIQLGEQKFKAVGCDLCHTPALQTGQSSSTALTNQTAHLYSDLLLHKMGSRLADGIAQGQAGGDEFRTAPLWGLGQRVFFLHDGRTRDLLHAIRAHQSQSSEANASIIAFHLLSDPDKQALLTFLRSL